MRLSPAHTFGAKERGHTEQAAAPGRRRREPPPGSSRCGFRSTTLLPLLLLRRWRGRVGRDGGLGWRWILCRQQGRWVRSQRPPPARLRRPSQEEAPHCLRVHGVA